MKILLALILFNSGLYDDVKANYYGDDSYRISQIQVEALSFEGDSLYKVMNWVARANYKQANYARAYDVLKQIPIDSVSSQFLYYDLRSLECLLVKNLGVPHYDEADSLYTILISELPDLPKRASYNRIRYRVHLNYAELSRLRFDHDKKLFHLNRASEFATGDSKDKTIRNVARHYVNIELNLEMADSVMMLHTPIDSVVSKESKSGYYSVVGHIYESRNLNKKASDMFYKSGEFAAQAGLISFLEDASDDYERSLNKAELDYRRNSYNTMVKIIIAGILLLAFLLDRLISKPKEAAQ